MSNPYNKSSQEAKYLSWEHGFNSFSQNDCPYEADTDDSAEKDLRHAWSQGFRANKNRPKAESPKSVIEETTQIISSNVIMNNNLTTFDIKSIPTPQLLQEVSRRLQEFESMQVKLKSIFG